MLIKRQRA